MLNSWHNLYLRITGIRKAVLFLYKGFWKRADSCLAHLLHFPAINIGAKSKAEKGGLDIRLNSMFSKGLGKIGIFFF